MTRLWISRAALAAAAALLGTSGCGEFETQSIVLDLRILSMVADPPEVVVNIDPTSDLDDLPQVDVEVCALVADPADARGLEYRMTACWTTESLRCDDPARAEVLLTGTPGDPYARVPDPEEAGEPAAVCATVPANTVLPVLLADQMELHGSFEAVAAQIVANGGNLDVQVELAVRGDGQGQDDLQYGIKRARFALPVPEDRVANQNPGIDTLQASTDGGEPVALAEGRCVDLDAPLEIAPGAELEIEPVATPGSREEYPVITFDGEVRRFTENLVYTWYATHGSWSREQSGGPRDLAGNEPPVDSTWTAPSSRDVIGGGLDVPIWVVQRDERGGQTWRRTCVRVVP